MPAADRPLVAAVVLAAGSSTRMGRNKLLLELGGETLVRRTVRTVIAAGLDRVLVVLGHEAERVEAELAGLPCSPLVNPGHAQGVGTSLRLGVGRAGEADAVVVVLADMPFVTASMIAAVVADYRSKRVPLVVSRYGDVEAPPILYDRALFAELLSVPDERCAKRVVRQHRAEAGFLDWPEAALRDIDVAQDYEQARLSVARG